MCVVSSHFQDSGFLGSVFSLPLWPALDFTSLSRASAKASSSSYLMYSVVSDIVLSINNKTLDSVVTARFSSQLAHKTTHSKSVSTRFSW